jgi:hypothetical protein
MSVSSPLYLSISAVPLTSTLYGRGYCYKMVPVMVTMGVDLQPGCLADRLLTGLGQPQINPKAQ